MDKRWIGILVIIIIACLCGYLVVNSSNTVGNAITDVNKSTVTLPHDFSVETSDSESTTLINKNTGSKIFIKDLGKKDVALDKFNEKFKNLSSDKSIVIEKNTSTVNDEIQMYSVFYKNDSEYRSFSYVHTYNHTYLIKGSGFSDANDLINKINFVANTIQPDYKKSQD